MSKDIVDSLSNLNEIANEINQINCVGLAQALAPLESLSSSYHDRILNISEGMLFAMEKSFTGWEQNNLTAHILSSPSTLIQQELAQIGNQYTRMLDSLEMSSYDLYQAMTGLAYQSMAMQSLVQVSQTPLVKVLKGFITNSNVEGCINAMTQAMGTNLIHASDLALARTSIFGQDLVDIADIPMGVYNAILKLNRTTSRALTLETDIIYDVEDEVYVDETADEYDIKVDSNEINAIGYACSVLNQHNDKNTGLMCDISAQELMSFMTFLSETRSFANEHPAGRKIFEAISYLWERQSYLGFDRDFYYHSRAIEKGQSPYVFQEMLRAPYGITGPGRYNYPGEAYYYTADTKEGAEAEVRLHNKYKGIQTVKLRPRLSGKFLDLSVPKRWGREFLKYIRFDASKNIGDKMPREYLIPNYVSDCCRLLGFDGIKYYGGKGYSNYVVWRDGYYEFVEMI